MTCGCQLRDGRIAVCREHDGVREMPGSVGDEIRWALDEDLDEAVSAGRRPGRPPIGPGNGSRDGQEEAMTRKSGQAVQGKIVLEDDAWVLRVPGVPEIRIGAHGAAAPRGDGVTEKEGVATELWLRFRSALAGIDSAMITLYDPTSTSPFARTDDGTNVGTLVIEHGALLGIEMPRNL